MFSPIATVFEALRSALIFPAALALSYLSPVVDWDDWNGWVEDEDLL